MAKRKGKSFYQRHRDKVNFAIAVLLMLLVVFVFSVIQVYFQQDRGDVVARVNGEPIYSSEVSSSLERLSLRERQSYSEEMVLEEIIQRRLLLQRIDDLDLEASDSELQEAYQDFLDNNNLNEESIDQLMRMQGMTKSDLMRSIEQQVLLNKLLEEEAFRNISVSEEEAKEFYEINAESFLEPETLMVEQALVQTANRTERQARMTAEEIHGSAKENGFEGFCETASGYVQEEESACGRYNITSFSGLPEGFVDAAFSMEDGESRVVETELGYHVIHRIESVPESLLRFGEVRDQIVSRLEREKQRQAYSQYLRDLRREADIENYLLDEAIRNVTAPEPTQSLEDTLACISERATLYGARWDSQTKRQLAMFGDSNITYIECSVPGSLHDKADACDEAGIQAYPTWIIGGETHLGVQSLEKLASLSGC